jgi:hypothetical protein
MDFGIFKKIVKFYVVWKFSKFSMNQVMVSKVNLKVGGKKKTLKTHPINTLPQGPISSLNNPLNNIEANFFSENMKLRC